MYARLIRERLAALGHIGANEKYIEAWMRVGNRCLDGFSAKEFDYEIKCALECINTSKKEDNDALVASFGL